MARRILIVEDSVVAMLTEKSLMEHLGCVVDGAKTGEEAVVLCGKNTYDLILMDIGLPGIDGIEATRQIRADEQAQKRTLVKIVAVTGNADPMIHKQCMEAGMQDVNTKPFTLKVAQDMLHTLKAA